MQVTKEMITKAREMFPTMKDKSDEEVVLAFILSKEICDEFLKNYKKQDR